MFRLFFTTAVIHRPGTTAFSGQGLTASTTKHFRPSSPCFYLLSGTVDRPLHDPFQGVVMKAR
jgi:hypothetical protein